MLQRCVALKIVFVNRLLSSLNQFKFPRLASILEGHFMDTIVFKLTD